MPAPLARPWQRTSWALFFSSSGYELFPYYLVMYTTLLYRLALQQQNNEATTLVKPPVQIGRRVYSPMSYRQV